MKTVARLSAEDRSDLFRNTANRMQMSDAIVEKDFWVCFTLDYLFHRSPWKDSIREIIETLPLDFFYDLADQIKDDCYPDVENTNLSVSFRWPFSEGRAH